jgi:hypothetical protein
LKSPEQVLLVRVLDHQGSKGYSHQLIRDNGWVLVDNSSDKGNQWKINHQNFRSAKGSEFEEKEMVQTLQWKARTFEIKRRLLQVAS